MWTTSCWRRLKTRRARSSNGQHGRPYTQSTVCPSETGTPDAKDPVSEKKLAQGDARWATTKEILGYWLDGVNRTIQLPPKRADDLIAEARSILKKQ
jgi:hypothetical protein